MNAFQIIRVLSISSTGLIAISCGTLENPQSIMKKVVSKEGAGLISKDGADALKKASDNKPCAAFVSADKAPLP